MIEGFDIICISTSDWAHPWGSRQQIMSRLMPKNRILFIEYQFSILHILKYPGLLNTVFIPRIRHVEKNSLIYRPWLNLPFGRYSRTINLLNQRLLLFQIRRITKKIGFLNILLWIFDPNSSYLVGRLNEVFSIYHCIDFFRNEKESGLRKRCISAVEDDLCRKCNIILASSNRLLEDKKKFNINTYLMPSAVGELFFDIDQLRLVPDDIKMIPSPRIGFIGTIDGRLDIELIDFIAGYRQDWAIVFIGDIQQAMIERNFRNKKNIYFLGQKSNKSLPAYINSFDVCIIPYIINTFTKGISPVKVYEYLALGKPVVSTDLPDLGILSSMDLIRIGKNKEEFYGHIADYLIKDRQDIISERIKFARDNTWQHRINSISQIINV